MELLDRIGSYNLFNNLLPGAIFCYLADRYFDAALISGDVFVDFFVFYFVGLICSRFGSLVLENVLRKIGLIATIGYQDFLRREQADTKLQAILEARNSYRSLLACVILLILYGTFLRLVSLFPILDEWRDWIFTLALAVVLAAAYVKQDRYVRERVGIADD